MPWFAFPHTHLGSCVMNKWQGETRRCGRHQLGNYCNNPHKLYVLNWGGNAVTGEKCLDSGYLWMW